jgi:hypothetical protein
VPIPCTTRILFLTVNRSERSSAELAQDIVHESRELVRLEIRLALAEAKGLLIRNAIAAGMLALGGVMLALAVFVALPVLLVLLWWNHVLGAIIWVGGYAVIGLALLLAGRLTLRLRPPQRTLESLQETRTWVLRQIRSNDR